MELDLSLLSDSDSDDIDERSVSTKEKELAESYRTRATRCFASGEFENAIELFSRLLTNHASHSRWRDFWTRGRCRFHCRHFREAVADTTIAIVKIRCVETDEDEELELAFEDVPTVRDLANGYNNRAWSFFKLDEFQLAIDDATECIRLNENCVSSYSIRGASHAGLGQFERAIKDQTESLDRSPDDCVYISNRALTFYTCRRFKNSLADFNKALTLNPGSPKSPALRGLVYIAICDYDRAYDDLTLALSRITNRLDDYWRAMCFWRRAFCSIKFGDFDEARTDLEASYSTENTFRRLTRDIKLIDHLGYGFLDACPRLGRDLEAVRSLEYILRAELRVEQFEFVLEVGLKRCAVSFAFPDRVVNVNRSMLVTEVTNDSVRC